MLDLEISINDVKNILKELNLEDYVKGPLEENLYKGSDMWIFGKVVKKSEIYIKITIGSLSDKVICISFHFAERTMTYPFK